MKSFSEFQRIYLHRDRVDMRKGINGLSALISDMEMGDLMGSNLFIFSGRRKNSIKILYFDKSGFCLWQKRLEKDRFKWPKKIDNEVVELSTEQLGWLLDGLDYTKMKPFESLQYEAFC